MKEVCAKVCDGDASGAFESNAQVEDSCIRKPNHVYTLTTNDTIKAKIISSGIMSLDDLEELRHRPLSGHSVCKLALGVINWEMTVGKVFIDDHGTNYIECVDLSTSYRYVSS